MKKLSVNALRKQVNERIDKADLNSLRRVNAILENDKLIRLEQENQFEKEKQKAIKKK